MKKINIPNWPIIAKLRVLFALLSQDGESRLVGGCVRDLILGKVPEDIDIATTIHPQRLLQIMEEHEIKAIPIGIDHGTVTVILAQDVIEITTLRKDIECYGRHAQVSFTDNWKEDALRRDFTINAMYLDLEGNLYDYFGGQQDLHNRLIRFIGDPSERIQEDALRILRFFRFYAGFGGDHLDALSLNAIITNATQVQQLSGERIKKEMFKMLGRIYASDALQLLLTTEVWPYISNGVEVNPQVYYYKLCDDPLINLAAIIGANSDPLADIEKLRVRWKFSNKESKMLQILCSEEYILDTINLTLAQGALYFLGKENFLKKLKLKSVKEPNVDYKILYDMVENLIIPHFPLTGDEVKKLGIKHQAIGEMILYATKAWINSNFSLEKEELLEMVKTHYLSRS